MGYRVIKRFLDLKDNYREYNVGDRYPRVGLKVSEKRLNQLSSDKNRRKEALIEFVEEAPPIITKEKEAEEHAPEKIVESASKKPKKGRKKNAD